MKKENLKQSLKDDVTPSFCIRPNKFPGFGKEIMMNHPTPFVWLVYACLLLSICGCSDVDYAFRVDTGIDPEYQDDEVRFTTTYYLRVFDVCDISHDKNDKTTIYSPRLHGALTAKTKGPLQIVGDSLHRFRMTGKASALYNNLHFESGLMDADALDPFGKSINFSQEQVFFR